MSRLAIVGIYLPTALLQSMLFYGLYEEHFQLFHYLMAEMFLEISVFLDFTSQPWIPIHR